CALVHASLRLARECGWASCMSVRPLLSEWLLAAIVFTLIAFTGQILPRADAQDRPGAGRPTAQQAIPTKSMLSPLRDGGPMMVPIAGCSFALLVFVFERFIALRRGRVIPRPFVRRFLEQLHEGQLDREKALKLCEANRSPVATVFAAAVRKWGKASVE